MIKNLKKVISSAAAVAMVASSASAFALTFPDVDESASYANAVSTLTGLGIVNGDDNGKFNPDNSVTRAEFAKMVVEALGDGDAAAASTYTSFADCQGHWAAGYIQTGVAKEFINGYDENTFGPDDTVTYAQAVKMLVGACGYDLWASKQGGWPSGYLSYGSSLKIINGVTGVGNDTAITRAQCAVLIYNALQAPLLAVNGYEYDNNGNLQPKYDQMDGENKDWQTMLTEYHDAYVVKGRVIETSKSNEALDAGVVKFDVESSDRYKDETVKKDKPVTGEEMYAGETNAEDLLFTYSEAIVQVDSDSDDITIISITPYVTSKTEEFSADDVVTAVEDSKNGKNPWEGQIAVKKSSTSSSTTKYDLETEGTKKAKLYVNGQVVATYGETTFKKAVEDYIINNPTGTVTIVDATEAGSTSTNGKYDYIMVTYYIDDIVEDVVTTSSKARINTKESQATLTWDLDNEDVKIKFVLDGEEIEYTDLEEDDVLSIAFTPATATKVADAKGGVTVLVSRDTISGTVSRVSDSTDNYAVVDGTEYEANGTTVSVSDDWTGNDYTFYLNAFGKIAKAVEGDTSKNYGVVVGMYKTAGNDYYSVRIVTADGEVKVYECKNTVEETAFKKVATDAGITLATGNTLFSKDDVAKTKAMKMAVSYTLSGDKIKLDSAIYEAGKGDSGLIFKEATGKVGSYQIVDGTTKILDLSSYFGANSSVATLTVNDFADDEQYTLYPYAKNNNGDYRFMLVLDGTTSLKANAPFAVVKEKPGKSIVDDTNVYSIKVALLNSDKTEEEAIVSVDDSDTVAKNLKEGDVIVYNEGSKGYVEVGQVKLVMSGVSSYKTLFEKTIVTNAADFDGMIAAVGSDNKSTVADQTGAKKVTKYYFGPVTLKNGNNIEIGTEANVVNGKLVTNISKDVASFTMSSDTKVYTYDYNEIEKYRVSVGAVPTVSSSFFDKYLQDNTDNLIWRKVADSEGSKNPNFALIKEYDDDVTEVVVFLADDTDLKSVVTETTTTPTEAPATEAPTVSPEPAEGE